MGHLSANPAGPDPSGERPVRREPASKGHHWLWIIALAAIVAVGFWYFRGSHASTEAQGPAAPGGSGKGQGRQGAGTRQAGRGFHPARACAPSIVDRRAAGSRERHAGVAGRRRGQLGDMLLGPGGTEDAITLRSEFDGHRTSEPTARTRNGDGGSRRFHCVRHH